MQQRFIRRARRAIVPALVAVVVAAACTPSGPSSPTTTTTPQGTVTRWTDIMDLVRVRLDDPIFVQSLGATQEERDAVVSRLEDLLADPAYQSDEQMTAEQINDVGVRDLLHQQDLQDQQATKDINGQTRSDARDEEFAADLGTLAGPLPDPSSVRAQGREDLTPFRPSWTDDLGKEGFADMAQTLLTRIQDVRDKIANHNLGNDLLAQEVAARLPLGGPPPPAPLTGGLCDNRVGDRFAPNPNTRPGTIYTPEQDTFARRSPSGATQFQGELQVRNVAGPGGTMVQQFLVEAHVMDTTVIAAEMEKLRSDLDLPPTAFDDMLGNVPTWLRAHLMVMYPGQVGAEDWTGDGPNNEADYEMLCYRDDATKGPGEPVNRAYVRAWLPMDFGARSLGEPGFQIRVAISDYFWTAFQTNFFFGSDLHTVHLGPEPLVYYSAADHSLGVTADRSFLVNTDAEPANDVEDLLRGVIETGVSEAIGALDETEWFFLDLGLFKNWGWLGASASDVAEPETITSDVSFTTTETVGTNTTDDERLLQVDVHADDIDIDGLASVPILGLGLIPCNYSVKLDLGLRAKFGLDIDRGFLSPDFLELAVTGLSAHDMSVSAVPLNCNLLHFVNVPGLLDGLVKEIDLTGPLGDDIAVKIRNVIHAAADIDDVVLPNGGGFTVHAQNLEPTCDPYGCNGEHAGDVALTREGAEVIDDPLVMDLKTGDLDELFSKRRFPVSYQPSPSVAGPIEDLITDHLDPDGLPYDLALWASPALLNQFLRAATEGTTSISFPGGGVTPPTGALPIAHQSVLPFASQTGLLDINAGGFRTHPQVAPIYVPDPDYPLALFLPDLEFSYGNGYYATNATVGVDVSFDPGTSKLSPATLSVADVAAGAQLMVLECESVYWLACVVAPSYVPDLVSWLSGTVLPPVVENSIGKIEVPRLAGFDFVSGKVENVDGNLAVYVDAG